VSRRLNDAPTALKVLLPKLKKKKNKTKQNKTKNKKTKRCNLDVIFGNN
jgi:hypothetical protein